MGGKGELGATSAVIVTIAGAPDNPSINPSKKECQRKSNPSKKVQGYNPMEKVHSTGTLSLCRMFHPVITLGNDQYRRPFRANLQEKSSFEKVRIEDLKII